VNRSSVVYIIGAGPGDPGLITVRGLRCLGHAGVVLHDHMVHPRLLRAPGRTRKRSTSGSPHRTREQEAICYLLAEKAREGKVVARLKWAIRLCSITVERRRSSCTSSRCDSR
jgi:uroporphyrinogen III methyltransferase/synthase